MVRYNSPAGRFAAYVTPDPKDGKRRPAIVWVTGGVCNTIGDVWSEAPRDNDQTAAAYREAGIVMMFPSLRGGNEGRGFQEAFYGEVDDVVAAAEHLAKLPYVDPARIYLGGHSTGGTLALLVSQSSARFRAVISFGPAGGILGYAHGGLFELPYDEADSRETKRRSPMFWMHAVQVPTYIFEGLDQPGNADELETLARWRRESRVARCIGVKGVNHFSILGPANKVMAQKILADTGKQPSLDLTAEDLNAISPGAADALANVSPAAPAAQPRARTQPRKPARPAIRQPAGGGTLEWTPVLGLKSSKRMDTVIGQTDRMTGLAFGLSDNGRIRSVAQLSMKHKLPAEQPNQKLVKARDGYVLYGVHVDATKTTVNAIRLVFVRFNADEDMIVSTDTYESDWIGAPTPATPASEKPTTLGCNGKRVVGITRSISGESLCGFGLALAEENTTAAKAPAKAPPLPF